VIFCYVLEDRDFLLRFGGSRFFVTFWRIAIFCYVLEDRDFLLRFGGS